ncbi:nuclear transport factor 2 family protein [Rhodococcus sp. 14C212]|uniref:nuclear transport factor 2 family protein n=1 Tax=Rhodococcus sp. 14C212 TaxID=2711209 RepID=UPI0013EAA5C8|nr:nuclear transport factor 2 family protein [Rhodococcus sp. 14C212]NGP09491.1 nuclear transport factor 2 family protein [Rhodococcus sp. 14C212]
MTKTKEEMVEIFQGYYDKVDAGDAAGAVTIYHPEVNWVHLPTTKQELGLSHSEADVIQSRDELEAYLTRVLPRAVEAGLVHTVQKLVTDGEQGALIGRTTSTVSQSVDDTFIAWFTLRDGLVSEYNLRPL